MKVKGSMPIDYRMSIEARPLRVLYTKYSSADSNNPLQCVRPLGSVRRQGSSAGKVKECLPKLSAGSSEARAHPSRRFCVSEIKMNNNVNNDCAVSGIARSEDIVRDAERPKEGPPLTHVGRSRSQAFEHKFKIAAARANGQESPPLKHTKDYNKKVIHLPLFRINLKTYTGDSEVNKAVKNTRENLRLLMDMHRSNLKPPNVKTANITNFEFNAPPTGSISVRKGDTTTRKGDGNMPNGYIGLPSFSPRQVLTSPRNKSLNKMCETNPAIGVANNKTDTERKHEASPDIECQFCAMEKATGKEQFVRFADDQVSSLDYGAKDSDLGLMGIRSEDDSNTDEDPDISMLSVAMRPDTALTLGSTMNEIDRVLQSPGSDELREISSVLRNNESQSTWPSFDEIIKMRSRNQSRRTKNNSRLSVSRPGTVQNGGFESPRKMFSVCSHHSNMNMDIQRPVMRYTSRPTSFKLKPIVVPSHTCTECPMCNLYKREKEGTPCPPNSPITSKEPQRFLFETNKPRSGASDRVRQRNQQEVMRLARFNVTGDVNSTVSDRNSLTFMKAH